MSQKIPQHVAIIMDGNGRWAENRGLVRAEGHRAGIDSVKAVVRVCLSKKIKTLSLFAFSRLNWARPDEEVEFLMQLFIAVLQDEVSTLDKEGVCLKFIGDRDRLSRQLCVAIDAAERLTAKNKCLDLNIAINYTGKWDIVQATKNIARCVLQEEFGVEDIDEALFSQSLSTHLMPDPDLFIRTSGEQRISDFFLWQLAFTELYFTDVYWPDFDEEEFLKALDTYALRERRYGLISQQIDLLQKTNECL